MCIGGGDWEKITGNGDSYMFDIEGTSVLFASIATSSLTFVFSPEYQQSLRPFNSSFSLSSRQETTTCNPSLWDATPEAIYGIQTFPSGDIVLPSSLRESPLIITTKALSPCEEIGMSKEILAPSSFFWEFVGGEVGGIDPNVWARGSQLLIPENVLGDRELFPPNQPVGLRVSVDVGLEESLVADVSVEFSASPIVVEPQAIFSSTYDIREVLVIDLSDSYSLDALGGVVWEWEWICVIPGERGNMTRDCV